MSVSYVAETTGATATDAASTTVAIPASAQTDDILILHICAGRTTLAPSISDDDTGGNAWSLLAEADEVIVYGGVYWKRATAGSAGKTVTLTGNAGDLPDSLTAAVSVYRGCQAGTPYEAAFADGVPSGVETIAGFTTTRDGAMVCLTLCISNNQAVSSEATATSPGLLSERFDYGSTAGSDIQLAHASASQATAGPTGAFSWAHTDTAEVAIVWALLPPGAAPAFVPRVILI